MPLTREQIQEIKNVADVAVKQLWLDNTLIKTITDKVSENILLGLNDKFEQFDKKLDNLQKSLSAVENTYKQEIILLKNKVDALEKKQSDSVSNTPGLFTIMSEMEEIKRRENNVLIFGMAEDVNTKMAVSELIQKVIPNYNTNNIVTSRLGKPLENKTRPIKIVLQNRADAIALLKSSKTLRTDDKYKNVSIRGDFTIIQREHYAKLKRERDERINNGETNVYIKYKNGFPMLFQKN